MPEQPLPRIGAHVSVAGGLGKVLGRVRSIEAEAVQIFSSNPRQWRSTDRPAAELEAFGEGLRAAGLPLFVHTIYLVNLASPDARLRRRSAAAVSESLAFAALAKGAGVVTHVGSHRGEGFSRSLGWISEAVAEAIGLAEDEIGQLGLGVPLLLESSAGSSGSVGGSPEEISRLLKELPRSCGVCLDTAHLYAAGYPIHEPEGLRAYLEEFQSRIGIERVGLVHLNDCRSEFGSRSDRHENLWEGRIGREGLAAWVRCPELRSVPFVLETPGFGKKGPDRQNVRRAKRLRIFPTDRPHDPAG